MDNPSINLITNIINPINNFFTQINCTNKEFYINKNLDDYNKNIVRISNEQYDFLAKSINKASGYLKNLNPVLQNRNPLIHYNKWNICVYTNMFFDLPFTMDDNIFIPESYLNKSMQTNTNNFVITLVHEQLHILQRYNQNAWDEYIKKNSNWILLKDVKFNKNITYYKTTQVANPDTTYPNKIYIIKYSNSIYWGELVKKDSNPKVIDQWFDLIPSNIPNTFDLYPIHIQISKYEHPYEELAYELSKNLVK